MDNLCSVLKNRKLWYDGDSTVSKELLYDSVLENKDISSFFIDVIDSEIKNYNINNKGKELKIKTTVKDFNIHEWNIPDNYKEINLRKYILTKLYQEVTDNSFSDEEIKKRLDRVNLELSLWNNNLEMLLKTLIYIVDTFTENNVVWGVGRGSSCCCYILYLIGVHNVDSVLYELDITEFFRD